MHEVGEKVFSFASFTLDLGRGCLRSADREVELRPKSFEVLRHLVENAGRLVSKDQLIQAVWPNVVVTDESLTRCVSDIRLALRDADRRVIKTVPRRGYLFAAPVSLAATGSGWHQGGARPLANHASIVVLPFINLNGDPNEDYLADVITEELTTSLSRARDSLVIARTTAFTYKGKAIDVRQVGRDLGVRYVLEGSEQHTSARVRVSAQLIDAQTGTHLWADQFDSDRADLWQLQDQIVTQLARALHVQLTSLEAARRTSVNAGDPNAEDLALRGDAEVNRWVTAGGYKVAEPDAALRLCERALELDPRNVRALIVVADLLSVGVRAARSTDREADIRRADRLVSLALSIDPDHYWAHYVKAAVLLLQKRPQAGLFEADRSLALNPSFVPAYLSLCTAHRLLGSPEKALEYADKAILLSPRDSLLFALYWQKGFAYFALRQDDQAIDWLRRGSTIAQDWSGPHAVLAAALALNGNEGEAHRALERYLAVGGVKTIAELKAGSAADTPAYLAYQERFFDGLRKAGMPEE
jgi:TolB-like protein/Tfp pilus assembly protein PilF